MNESTCSCERCQALCRGGVCMPTPDEVRALVRRGHAGRLSVFNFAPAWAEPQRYVMPSPAGREGHEIAANEPHGPCTFYAGGKCALHDAGLKPLEGRLARHDTDWRAIRVHVMRAWVGRRFDSVHKALVSARKA